jgi:hypothetical protein
MTCQGGPLGYADVFYLRQGRTVQGEGGKIYTPSLLTGDGGRLVGYRSRVFDTMLRCLKHAPESPHSSLDWLRVTASEVEAWDLRKTCSYPHCGVSVLEPLEISNPDPCSGCRYVPCGNCDRPDAADNAQADGTNLPRITAADDGVLLHLPEITYLDTQIWAADIGLTTGALQALRDAATVHLDTASTPKPTPCDEFPCEDGGEPCAKHEREWAHEEGDHGLCEQEITCEVAYPFEEMRNYILWRAAPGSGNMLKELLRRAANRSALMEAHLALAEQARKDQRELAELKARMEGLEE